MICALSDLRDKFVVNIKDCVNLGRVDDLVFDTQEGAVVSLVVYGRKRGLGILGREEDLVIKWEDIEIIGEDTILVSLGDETGMRPRDSRPRADLFFRE